MLWGVEKRRPIVEEGFKELSERQLPSVLADEDQGRNNLAAFYTVRPCCDWLVYGLACRILLVLSSRSGIAAIRCRWERIIHIFHRDINQTIVVNEGERMIEDCFFAARILTLQVKTGGRLGSRKNCTKQWLAYMSDTHAEKHVNAK